MTDLEALAALFATDLYVIPCNETGGNYLLCYKSNLLRRELRRVVENLCRDIGCEYRYYVLGVGSLPSKDLALRYATKVSGTHDPHSFVEDFLCISSNRLFQSLITSLTRSRRKGKGQYNMEILKGKKAITATPLFFVFLMEAFKLGLRHHEFRTSLRNFLHLALPQCKVMQEHRISPQDKVDVLVECNNYCIVFEIKSPEDIRVSASKNTVSQLVKISSDLEKYCYNKPYAVLLIEIRGNLPQKLLAELLRSIELYNVEAQQHIQLLSANIIENLLRENTNVVGATLEDFLKKVAERRINTLDYIEK